MSQFSKIGVVDYGSGNIKSVSNMLRKLGVASVISENPNDFENVSKIIIPGVGAFDTAMDTLNQLGFVSVLNRLVLQKNTPVLGICLGMQLLAEKSEEGEMPGFGWIAGEIIKLNITSLSVNKNKLKIPHMGWNSVTPVQSENPLFNNIPVPMRFYFVHSYQFLCTMPENVLATTQYGFNFTCAVRRNNIYGVQFHPEKSHRFGMQVLKNFAEFA